jgi:hypothetical protein
MLPPEKLASMVSNVTEAMLGITFLPAEGPLIGVDLCWRTALLPIAGARPITVGLSSDQTGCRALCAAMFLCGHDDVDSAMIDDSLGELLNMTAGLVKKALVPDQSLGLPRIVKHPDPPPVVPPDHRALVLRAKDLDLVLWVTDGLLG